MDISNYHKAHGCIHTEGLCSTSQFRQLIILHIDQPSQGKHEAMLAVWYQSFCHIQCPVKKLKRCPLREREREGTPLSPFLFSIAVSINDMTIFHFPLSLSLTLRILSLPFALHMQTVIEVVHSICFCFFLSLFSHLDVSLEYLLLQVHVVQKDSNQPIHDYLNLNSIILNSKSGSSVAPATFEVLKRTRGQWLQFHQLVNSSITAETSVLPRRWRTDSLSTSEIVWLLKQRQSYLILIQLFHSYNTPAM